VAKSRPARTTSPRRRKQVSQPAAEPVNSGGVPPILRALIDELRDRIYRAENLTYAARELLVAWPSDIDQDRQHAVISTLECARDEALKTGEAVDSLEQLVNRCPWGAELAAASL
jgi:hypothetical protein